MLTYITLNSTLNFSSSDIERIKQGFFNNTEKERCWNCKFVDIET